MKVTIIGAGLGGLTTALFLEKSGFSVEIYEQANQIKPVGAGIILAHNAMQVYDKLGLKSAISDLGHQLSSVNIVTPQLRVISSVDAVHFDQKYGVQNIAIQRGVLQELLINALQKTRVHLNKKLTEIKEGDNVSLLFSDGSEVQSDLVIAADGIRSVVRNTLFSENTIRKAHQICWRGIANTHLQSKYAHQLNEAWGHGTRFGFVQISPNQIYWYALQNSDQANDKQKLTDVFSEYSTAVTEIISKTCVDQIIQNDIEDLKPINHWFKGKACLLGDAAHATTPNMGQGACQAIEDAYVLSHFLNNYPSNIAFKKYQQMRMKKAKKIVNMSWAIGKVSHIKNPFMSKARNLMMRLTPTSINQKQSEKIFALPRL